MMPARGALRRLLWLLALALLAGCAQRASHTVVAADALDEATARELVSRWQAQLCATIAEAGEGDAAVLVELKRLRSHSVLRPARIRFGLLDVEASGRLWDVQGVLVGTQKQGVVTRHVFVVGVVGYTGFLPSAVSDIRLIALTPLAGTLAWETGTADRAALNRYRATFGAAANRFPADEDDFRLQASRELVSVRELRSGADWSLKVRSDMRDTHGASVSNARRAAGAGEGERCRPR